MLFRSGAGLRGDSERLLIKPRILSHSETTASNLALLFKIFRAFRGLGLDYIDMSPKGSYRILL